MESEAAAALAAAVVAEKAAATVETAALVGEAAAAAAEEEEGEAAAKGKRTALRGLGGIPSPARPTPPGVWKGLWRLGRPSGRGGSGVRVSLAPVLPPRLGPSRCGGAEREAPQVLQTEWGWGASGGPGLRGFCGEGEGEAHWSRSAGSALPLGGGYPGWEGPPFALLLPARPRACARWGWGTLQGKLLWRSRGVVT